MDVYQAVTKRRSIRRFKDKAVPIAALERCIDAARVAPSGRNVQACEFIVVNDVRVLPGVFENIGGSVKLPFEKGGPGPDQHPRAYTVIVINRSWEGDPDRRRVTHYDIGIAAQSIILTAFEQGIGTCPILMINEDGLKKALKIPDGYDAGMVIAMGYPDESPVTEVADPSPDYWIDDKAVRHVPKRKLEDVIHRNGF